jgi:hypothetical protein
MDPMVSQSVLTYFIAEMSVDRAIAILFPMKAATICTTPKAVKITGATGILELLHLMTFFVLCLLRDVPHARWFEQLYKSYLLIFGTILPFSTLAV